MSEKSSVIDRPILITVVFGLMVILGIYMVFQLSLALFPEISPPVVVVSTTYAGAAPTTVEKTVTKTLESSLTNVSSLQKMTSTSSESSSLIIMEFSYGYDLDTATNDVRDKISAVRSSLPTDCKDPQIFKYDPSSMPIMQIAVRGNRSAEELRKIGEDSVQNALQRISGVSEASVSGGRTQAVRVDISQTRLEAYGITLSAVSAALAKQNLELGGGKITEGLKNYSVRTTGEFKTVDEIAQTVVATKNGYGVRLSDIATVNMGYKEEDSSVFINGQAGVYVSIKKQSGGNTVQIGNRVKADLPAIQKDLPKDVKLEVISDDTTMITSTVNTLVHSAFEAIIFAMIVIFVFLRSIKTTFIIGLSIPISLAMTFLAMHFFNLTLNIFTMTGLILGIGMIVDDSIVIMENIVRYRERGMKNRMAALIGSQEMRNAVMASTLTTVFVFLPILIFKSQLEILGILFQDMVFTIVISLLSSLAVALFLVPVMTSRYFPLVNRLETPIRNPLFRFGDKVLAGIYEKISNGYRWLLAMALRNRRIVILAVVASFLVAIGLISALKFTFAPSSVADTVTLNIELPVGTAIAETKEVLRQYEEIVKSEVKGYTNVIRTAGSGGSGHFSSSSDTFKGSLKVVLPPKDQQIDGEERIKEILRAHYKDFPSAKFSFDAGMGARMSGSTAPVDIMISSDNLDAAITTGQSMVDLIKAKVPDATEVAMDMNTGLPQVEVIVDRKRAYAMGVDVTTVADEIYYSVNGVAATTYNKNGDEYDVWVSLQESDRTRIIDLNRIFVTTSTGATVSVSNFAKLERGSGPLQIKRQNKARVVHVTANLKPGATSPEVEAKIKTAVSANMIIDPSIHVSYEGDMTALIKMAQTMLVVLIIAILLVFGVMAAQYESFKNPIINLFTLPLMIIGVAIVYTATGQPMNLFSAVGVIMLIGLVVKNGIVMIDYTNLLRGRGLSVKDAALEAGVVRLRPVLMTSLTAILGMIPLAFGSGEGSELVQPIGITVIGGLTSATLMTLFFIPVMYSLFNKDKAPVVTDLPPGILPASSTKEIAS